MTDEGIAYHRLHALCSQFDAVLQAHRTMLLTSQSILLSLAVFAAQDHAVHGTFPWLGLTLFAMGMFMLFLWIRVVIPGGHDVAYCQWQLLLLEAGENDHVSGAYYTDLVRWQRIQGPGKMQRLRSHPLGTLLMQANQSRHFLNYGLPAAFALCWVSLVAYVLR